MLSEGTEHTCPVMLSEGTEHTCPLQWQKQSIFYLPTSYVVKSENRRISFGISVHINVCYQFIHSKKLIRTLFSGIQDSSTWKGSIINIPHRFNA
jgi:hypothetical protein